MLSLLLSLRAMRKTKGLTALQRIQLLPQASQLLLASADTQARAYGWEIGWRGIRPGKEVDASINNPFVHPDWRNDIHG